MPTNAQAVAQKLLQHGCHITFAESCTAGLCAARLGEIPNISHIFDQSFVTYANEAKIALLGVDPALIEQYGVVSEPVALQMAIGASARTGAQVAVGISGIVNALAPEMILVGGGVSRQGDRILDPVRKYLAENCFDKRPEALPIVAAAQMGNEAGIVGAAALS